MGPAIVFALLVVGAIEEVLASLQIRIDALTSTQQKPMKWQDVPKISTPIVFFGPYSGALPATFPLTLESMRVNQDCCTFIALHCDDQYPEADMKLMQIVTPPPNFLWVHLTGFELERLFAKNVGVEVQSKHVTDQIPQLHHKWNDWRVFAPALLKDRLTKDVEFWGYLEHDAVYGRVASFLPHIRQYEVFTAGDVGLDRVNAPFVLHRLGPTTDKFVQHWKDVGCLRQPQWLWCDEGVVTDCIQQSDDSLTPCAAPSLRYNFPAKERRFCEPQIGVSAAWDPKGGAFCDGKPVLGLHFHFQRPHAVEAMHSLTAGVTSELINMGWSYEPAISPDPECPSCPSWPARFQAGTHSTTSPDFGSARLHGVLLSDFD